VEAAAEVDWICACFRLFTDRLSATACDSFLCSTTTADVEYVEGRIGTKGAASHVLASGSGLCTADSSAWGETFDGKLSGLCSRNLMEISGCCWLCAAARSSSSPVSRLAGSSRALCPCIAGRACGFIGVETVRRLLSLRDRDPPVPPPASSDGGMRCFGVRVQEEPKAQQSPSLLSTTATKSFIAVCFVAQCDTTLRESAVHMLRLLRRNIVQPSTSAACFFSSASSSHALTPFNGVFCVAKPAGATSTDVVTVLKKVISPRLTGSTDKAVRIGHGGTLDRLATGVLVIGVRRGTKQLQLFLQGEKEYLARGRLGVDSPSHDLDGVKLEDLVHQPYAHVTLSSLESFLATRYLSTTGGLISQTPPLYSALKLDGRRLSYLARGGKGDQVDLDRKTREVTVYSISVSEWAPPFYTLTIRCGGGFYVRSLVRDIGEQFRCGSVVTQLHRTRQSGFALDQAHVISMKQMRVTNVLLPSDHVPSEAIRAGLSATHHLECTRNNIADLLAIPVATRQAAVIRKPV
jgi:tRNA pseudouridine55 synthase